MRVHVALSPSEFADAPIVGRTVLAVDVLRATSAAVAACEAGCRRVVPVPDEAAAEALRDGAGVVLAGERGGHPIPGFDLGNSPLEFTPARVEGPHRRPHHHQRHRGHDAGRGRRGGGARRAHQRDRGGVLGARSGPRRDDPVRGGQRRLLAGGRGVRRPAGRAADRRRAARRSSAEARVAARALGLHYEGRLPRLAADSLWARRLARPGARGRPGRVPALRT